jgi:hypothetical protein
MSTTQTVKDFFWSSVNNSTLGPRLRYIPGSITTVSKLEIQIRSNSYATILLILKRILKKIV